MEAQAIGFEAVQGDKNVTLQWNYDFCAPSWNCFLGNIYAHFCFLLEVSY